MKRLVLLLCLWWTGASLMAQEIVGAEYFIDKDPGYGKGIFIALTPAREAELTLTIPMGNLDPGLHHFYSRVMDSSGVWSHTSHSSFLLCRLQQDAPAGISRMEYFLDADPGFGSALPVGLTEGVNLNVAVDLPLDMITTGMHTLCLRAEDNNGNWSMVFCRNILVQKLPPGLTYKISRLEYFFDEDPGFGSGIPVSFQEGDNVSVEADLPLESLSSGLHTLYVRARDDKGSWGMVFNQSFVKFENLAANAKVVRLEYFVNEDPGFGKGTPVELNTPRVSVMKYFVVDPGELQPGTNTLYVRALDSQGRWGMVHTQSFEVLEAAPCEPPTDLFATDVTDTSAVLGWTEQGQGSEWDLLWLPAGLDYSEDGVLGAGNTENPDTLESLMSTTLYGFYVRTACADGQVSGWAGPGQFYTLPLPVNTLTLQADPPGGGILTGEGPYTYGDTATISAIPNTNFIFQNWSGDTLWLDHPGSAIAKMTMPAQPVTLTAHFLDVTGIRETPGVILRVYPNPAHGLLRLELDGPDELDANLALMNTLGQVVREQRVRGRGIVRTSLSLSGLNPGVYILVIQGSRWKEERRIIVR